MIPRLKTAYEKEIVTKLMTKLSVKNKHEVPKIEKIILNMGLGEDGNDNKKLKACLDDMALIAGQRPIITKFKKSISNFKTRKGQSAGVKVTLRSSKMYEFVDRLVSDQSLRSCTQQDEARARAILMETDLANGDHNILRGDPSLTSIFDTYNPSSALIR